MGTKIIVFFDFEKLEKISEIFWEILGNFSKKIEGDKTPNFKNFKGGGFSFISLSYHNTIDTFIHVHLFVITL